MKTRRPRNDVENGECSASKKRQLEDRKVKLEDHMLFMRLACVAATRSNDPNTTVGAVIVRGGREIIATGYNGFVQHRLSGAEEVGDNDKAFSWKKEDKPPYVVHAEHNAILNTINKESRDCSLYVTRNPCNECAKFVINSGISEVIYHEDKEDGASYQAAKTMLKEANVETRSYSDALLAAGAKKVPRPTKFDAAEDSDRPNWEQYFMAMAKVAAERSEDPHTKVGAVIVNANQRMVGIGYNAMPYGCEQAFKGKWDKKEGKSPEDEDWIHTKYPYVVHAVQMAMMNKNSADLSDCKLYVTLFPDDDCAKSIIQAKIKKVIYLEDSKKKKKETRAAKEMFDYAGVKHRPFKFACAIKLKLVNEEISLVPWVFKSESAANDAGQRAADSKPKPQRSRSRKGAKNAVKGRAQAKKSVSKVNGKPRTKESKTKQKPKVQESGSRKMPRT